MPATAEGRAIRKHRPDYKIVLFAGLLVLIGLVVLFAISPYQIHRLNEAGGNVDQAHFMLKQGTYLAIGLAAFFAASRLSINWWQRYGAKILLAGIAACAVLAVLGLGNIAPAMCYNGACRWYDFGPISFQPAELLKFGTLVFGAVFLGRRVRDQGVDSTHDSLVPMGIIMAVGALLVIGLQKDMGTGLTILGVMAAMLYVAGLSYKKAGLIAGVGIAAGLLFIVVSPHRLERVATFMNSSNSDASSYHIEMAKLAIGSGGLTGKGLGNGVQAFGYLPEALNDSIFAILGESFGFIGLVVILALFAALLYRLIRIIDRTSDPTMRLLVAGVFGWLATHVVVNIGAMTGILPLTGVTLPFLSFGGTSLLFTMVALGIVYHISQYTIHSSEGERGRTDEATSGRGRIGRPRYSSSRRHQ